MPSTFSLALPATLYRSAARLRRWLQPRCAANNDSACDLPLHLLRDTEAGGRLREQRELADYDRQRRRY